jgi:hypothetical protein
MQNPVVNPERRSKDSGWLGVTVAIVRLRCISRCHVKAAMPLEKELYPFKLSSIRKGYDIHSYAAIIRDK